MKPSTGLEPILPLNGETLGRLLQQLSPDQCFVLCDEGSYRHCWPLLRDRLAANSLFEFPEPIVVASGDGSKSLETLTGLWQTLSDRKATRQSLWINLGGGMVCDLGGMAAATFKRGLRCVNIPTTLLAMVDAAQGGKKGINFGQVKNEIGVVRPCEAILLDTAFLDTLPPTEWLCGYAEMIKHGLLAGGDSLQEVLSYSPEPDFPAGSPTDSDATGRTMSLITKSMALKASLVAADPEDRGPRQALNLGHTIGHALEALSWQRWAAMNHGTAVAYGLVGELYLSARLLGFPRDERLAVNYRIKELYPPLELSCRDYPVLLELMRQDKKNTGQDEIRFTLLESPGLFRTGQAVTETLVTEALDCLREFLGC